MVEFNDNQYWDYPHMHHLHPVHRPMPSISTVGDDSEYDAFVLSSMGEGPKGEQGKPAYFDDLTDEQLVKIYQEASFVGNKSLDAIVTTAGDSTTAITIPIANYDEFDMLFIDVNGLDLSEHDDYEISGDKVILTTLLPAGQDVHFRALRYLVPDGSKSIQITDTRKDYNTVAEMQADTTLEAGDICHTLGFHAAGDGGAAWYKVAAHGVANGMDILQLDNGGVAELQVTESYVTPEMFGAWGDGVHDDTDAIKCACSKYSYVIFNNVYIISDSILLNSNTHIDGTGKINSNIDTQKSIFTINNKKNVLIENITLTANIVIYDNVDHGSTGDSHNGISCIGSCENIFINNVSLNKFSYSGIYVYQGKNIYICNCKIISLTSEDSALITGTNNYCFGIRLYSYLEDSIIDSNYIKYGCVGIYTPHSNSNLVIKNNTIKNVLTQHGIYASGSVFIENNYINSVKGNGINFQADSNTDFSNFILIIKNNKVFNSDQNAIAINNLVDVSASGFKYIECNVYNNEITNCDVGIYLNKCRGFIHNNKINSIESYGVFISNTSKLIFEDNSIVDYGLQGTSKHYGLYVYGENKVCNILNNYFYGDASASGYSLVVNDYFDTDETPSSIINNNICLNTNTPQQIRFIRTGVTVKKFQNNVYDYIVNAPTEA